MSTTTLCTSFAIKSSGIPILSSVGDSITAGVHSSGGNTTYPAQLGILLGNKYKVTNLGACGSTMMKHSNRPYWKRPQYKTLVRHKWDIIIIMLGTNDAKDKGHHGPPNWPHDCTGPRALDCAYARDYADMIKVVRSLGRTPKPPKIYLAIPPPLMKDGAYGMNGTVINDVFPILIPQINSANHVPNKPIDIFDAMGGKDKAHFPPGGCTLENSHVADCRYFCDHQSCDQCHPDDVGYHAMAVAMKKGMGL
eukprot:TRINITY_DN62986_c0_g1_i2.p1 TRINITY_DN62986_c0_g1~~TRINITY_DN62986_c0_g1_i2.p1  ORF type:complete len:251 (+),score=26.62 TRINITY_DN62986_c0_g1_i2:154-906(+)